MFAINLLSAIFFLSLSSLVSSQYQPTWESLDARPLPPWYDEAKFGIFMHWGVYSVPSFGSEWFWYNWKGRQNPKYVEFMKKNYPPTFEYTDFAPMFKAEFFDPVAWAKLLTQSGARYVHAMSQQTLLGVTVFIIGFLLISHGFSHKSALTICLRLL